MKYDDYFKLSEAERDAAYDRLTDYQRGMLIAEGRAKQADVQRRIRELYEGAYKHPLYIKFAERAGIPVKEFVHSQIGAPDVDMRPSTPPTDPHVQNLRKRLGLE